MRKLVLLLLALVASFAITSLAAAQDEAPAQEQATTIMDVVKSDERLTTFRTLVEAAALADNLDEDGPFTVFAPTDEAFVAFEAMSNANVDLIDVLLYHVANGSYDTAALTSRSSVPTLMGERLHFNRTDDVVRINQLAAVSIANIQTANGVIHIIDRVLLPSTVQTGDPEATIMELLEEDGRFETLLSLINSANLQNVLNDTGATYTFFAPTDDAFAAAPDSLLEKWTADPEGELATILTYHIVGDILHSDQIANDTFIPTWEGRALRVNYSETDGLFLNGQSIDTADMQASNGVVHVVNGVLIP